MKKIYKYKIDSNFEFVDLPANFEVIRVDKVDGEWFMWAIVYTDDQIYKFAVVREQIPVMERYNLEVPQGATLIHSQDVNGVFFIWYVYEYDIDSHDKRMYETRKLVFFKTGQPIPDNLRLSPLIGTCKLFIMQELCLYCFEVLNYEPTEVNEV